MVRNIGLNINPPEETCNDSDCPFHGSLKVRGRVFDGEVVNTKMQKSITIRRDYLHKIKKYDRYQKRRQNYLVHLPSCIHVKEGDRVKVAECRPLGKSISFVVVQKMEDVKGG
ncbi:MAG: 30S ribosomal protein S17 [Candidatus Ranarchaeia archaeon]